MIFQADYVKKFFCDGKICSSRCCRDWKIPVDEQALQNFSKLDDDELKNILQNLEQDNFSAINLTADGFCSFLDKNDFLCKIQKTHGEFFLPKICRTFPRVIYKISEDFFMQSMTLTCPVAAKIILLGEKISFEEVDEIPNGFIIDFQDRIKKSAKNIIDLQMNAIKILQDKNISINVRLKKFCEFFGVKNFAKFDEEKSSAVLIEIFAEMYGAELNQSQKNNLCENFLQNRKINLSEKILENYLTNEFFMRCYPYAFLEDELTNCKIFVASFKFLEFALILTSIVKKNLQNEDWINLICAVNDKIDHSKGGMNTIKNFVKICDEKTFSETMLEE